MLLVVLLCAFPTGGTPRTRHVGSAFDPAAIAVAVSPKRPRLNLAAKNSLRRDPLPPADTGTPVAGDHAEIVFAVAVASPLRAAPLAQAAATPLPRRLLTRPLGTRAPPRA